MEPIHGTLLHTLLNLQERTCLNCHKVTKTSVCTHCNHVLQANIPPEHARHLCETFNRLQKYKMLGTGVSRLDGEVRAAHGDWLLPSEEYNALLRESRKPGLTEAQKSDISALLAIRIKKGIKDDTGPWKAFFELSVRLIPFAVQVNGKDTGETGMMKLRQLFIWAMVGTYRVTRRGERYSCIDSLTGKKVYDWDSGALESFLRWHFSQDDIFEIMEVML